jgi:hypothetical protein
MRRAGRVILVGLLTLLSPSQADLSADLGAIALFPADNYWHWDISNYPSHPNSANFVSSVGAATRLHPDFGSVLDGVPWDVTWG